MTFRSDYSCPRCGIKIAGAAVYGEHFRACTKPFTVPALLAALDVRTGKNDECWLAERPNQKFVIEGRWIRAYTLMAEAAHGPRPDGLLVCHTCDDRRCYNPEHLYYGTYSDNGKDAWRNERRVVTESWKRAIAEGREAYYANRKEVVPQ